jgi:predicted DNA-binding transcriptional regulator YafY
LATDARTTHEVALVAPGEPQEIFDMATKAALRYIFDMRRNRQIFRILSIARDLSLAPDGVLVDDLCDKHGMARRTIERDIAALAALGHTIETFREESSGLVRKRIGGSANGLTTRLGAAELAAARTAAGALAEVAAAPIAATFRILLDRLEQTQPTAARVDAATLVAAQAFVGRPRYAPQADPELIAGLQNAILRCARLNITYSKGGSDPPRVYLAEPYGILFGGKNYLIWRGEDSAYRKFALAYIGNIEPVGTTFVVDPAFSMRAFAADSIGIMADDVLDITLRIAPGGRARLSTFLFHPSQQLIENTDGSTIVRFRAGGLDEICDQIFTWGALATVLGPPRLAASYLARLQAAQAAALPVSQVIS